MKIQIKKTIQKSQRDKSILLVANRVEAGIRTRDFSPISHERQRHLWFMGKFTQHFFLSWKVKILFMDSFSSKLWKWYFVTKILFWPTVRKNCFSDRENFWNSRRKVENLQNFWDHQKNLFKQWKVRIIFGNRMLF